MLTGAPGQTSPSPFLQTPHRERGCRDCLTGTRSAVADAPPDSECVPASLQAHAVAEHAATSGHRAPRAGWSGRVSRVAVPHAAPGSPRCPPPRLSPCPPSSVSLSPLVCLPVPPGLQQPRVFTASVLCLFQNIIFLKSCGMKPFHVDFSDLAIGA